MLSHPDDCLVLLERRASSVIIALAREMGVSTYIGDGLNRWLAVHCVDTAHLYRLALEKGTNGATYHGFADGSILTKASVLDLQRSLPLLYSVSADHTL